MIPRSRRLCATSSFFQIPSRHLVGRREFILFASLSPLCWSSRFDYFYFHGPSGGQNYTGVFPPPSRASLPWTPSLHGPCGGRTTRAFRHRAAPLFLGLSPSADPAVAERHGRSVARLRSLSPALRSPPDSGNPTNSPSSASRRLFPSVFRRRTVSRFSSAANAALGSAAPTLSAFIPPLSPPGLFFPCLCIFVHPRETFLVIY